MNSPARGNSNTDPNLSTARGEAPRWGPLRAAPRRPGARRRDLSKGSGGIEGDPPVSAKPRAMLVGEVYRPAVDLRDSRLLDPAGHIWGRDDQEFHRVARRLPFADRHEWMTGV